jgi:large subunit ribosomal protein L25
METLKINAQPRSDMGKGASRRLRHTGQVPGIIYGAHKDPEMITLSHNELLRHLEHEAFYSHILELLMGDRSERVILKDLQRHPARPFVLHADFQRISESEKIRVRVPLHFIGSDQAPGVKIGGGIISHNLSDVEIDCLPKDLPEFIEVDISGLNLNQSLHLSDLKLPEGVVLHALHLGPEHDMQVVSLHSPSGGAEEVEEEAAPTA